MAPFIPRTLAISPGGGQTLDQLAEWARAAVLAGVDGLQLRDKELPDHHLLASGRLLRSLVPPSRLLLVSQRADIAVAMGATGVHLPSASVPIDKLRRGFPGLLLGKSTHSLEDIEDAREAGADYVTYGPVYPPLSKRSALPAVGPELLQRAALLGPPVLALGGVTAARLEEIAAAGAAGVAGIGSFRDGDGLARFVVEAHRLFQPRDTQRKA